MNQTQANPRTALGVRFDCWASERRTFWRSEDGRLSAGQNPFKASFWAAVDDAPILGATGKPRRFLTLGGAMEAAVQQSRMAAR